MVFCFPCKSLGKNFKEDNAPPKPTEKKDANVPAQKEQPSAATPAPAVTTNGHTNGNTKNATRSEMMRPGVSSWYRFRIPPSVGAAFKDTVVSADEADSSDTMEGSSSGNCRASRDECQPAYTIRCFGNAIDICSRSDDSSCSDRMVGYNILRSGTMHSYRTQP